MPQELVEVGELGTGERLLGTLENLITILLNSKTAQLSPEDRTHLEHDVEWIRSFITKKEEKPLEPEQSNVKEPENIG